MNSDGKLGSSLSGWLGRNSFGVEFVDDFFEDGFARLVTVDVDEKIEFFVMLEYWDGLGAKFFKASMEGFDVAVVSAVAAVTKSFGGSPAVFYVGFGNIEKNYCFYRVIGFGGGGKNLIFFASPAPNRRKYERKTG